ncbi:MAG: FecR family protein, partial [Stenotrophomonas sp.]
MRNTAVRPSLLLLLATVLLFCWAGIASAQDWNYRARPGDTLWDLGARYLKNDVQWQQLQAHNQISDPYRLVPGQTLRFPIIWLRVQPAPARVAALRGQVQVSDPVNGSRPLQADMLLPIGTQLQTGEDASVTLVFADDSRLQLRENSQLQLDQLSSYGATGMVDTRVRLQRGRSSSHVTPA